MIVANNVAEAGSGFDGDTNIATILDRTGASQSLPLMSKDELADRIYDHYLAFKNRR
jgi:phosphopantothenoylcysteine decarboxylase/phosphopantothenate--cysteine ligase